MYDVVIHKRVFGVYARVRQTSNLFDAQEVKIYKKNQKK